MSKDITEITLMKAGFRRESPYKWRKGVVSMEVNRGTISNRSFICYVYTEGGRFVHAMLPVDTVEQFNRFMELMGMELRLEEEKNIDEEITKRVLFDAGFKVGGTHENLFKLEHGFYKIMIGPVEDNTNGKKFLCTVEEPRRRVHVASIAISTVADFNKLMDLMDIDFKLKESDRI